MARTRFIGGRTNPSERSEQVTKGTESTQTNMAYRVPKLLFVGAGNIAQSIMKGIIKAQPEAAEQILATAPTLRNLNLVKNTLGCQTILLDSASNYVREFNPDFVFLCVKPQVLMDCISSRRDNMLRQLLSSMPVSSTTLSLLAGVKCNIFSDAFSMQVVRVMLNTAAEIGYTSVLYYPSPEVAENSPKVGELEQLLNLISQGVVRLNDENLMDVATGVCGSGIAFFYEMIQTISDVGVKNGLGRADATLVAAQLSKSAAEMLLKKQLHPYQLRDEVTSPAGTTIYGLSSWHENATGQKIGNAFQASIDRARSLSAATEDRFNKIKNR